MRDRFLLAGVVLSALFAGLFVLIIRRMLTRPLRNVIALARMADGSVYMDKKEVKVTIGGCGG